MINQSFADLREDFEICDYILSSNLSVVDKIKKEIFKNKKNIQERTADSILESLTNLETIYQKYKIEVKKYSSQINDQNLYSIELLQNEKDNLFNLIRSYQNILGAIITSSDWQSPSFNCSLYPQAGRQTGTIIGNINDYKRDGRLDNKDYEQKFLKEYIDLPKIYKLFVYPFVTSSGMSAFTTVINFLIGENKIKNKIVIGKSCYFENKHLLKKIFKDEIVEVEENDTGKILKTIKKENPGVIYFDSICNNIDISSPDLNTIITYLLENNSNELYLIIDNTVLSTYFQPLKRIFGNRSKVNLIIIESLNKYHQFGMDRVNGGIIIGYGKDTGKIIEYRAHSGTNIPDSSIYSLPSPNRTVFEKRLKRIGRNAQILCEYLNKIIKNSKQIESIRYCGLKDYEGFKWQSSIDFHGGFFSVKFKKEFQKISVYKKFIAKVIAEAKKNKVNIVEGTSFGFDTTRIYLTASRTDFGIPFVRISPGTENLNQMDIIKKVFFEAIIK